MELLVKSAKSHLVLAVIGFVVLQALGQYGRAQAQKPVSISGSERQIIKSATNGIEYQIDVALPSGYAASDKRYPVFYVLDGNLSFAGFLDAFRQLRLDGGIPPIIVVGVGYKEDDPAVFTPAYAANRNRDYTPTSVDAAMAGSGRAPAFLNFLKDELIPLIDKRYRTNPADRGLGGHSLGGLFSTYALLTEPDLFQRYWLGSPSLWWDHQVSFTWLDQAAARDIKPHGRAFLTVGGLEPGLMIRPMERMALELTKRFPRLEVNSIVFPEETHTSVIGGAVSRALRFLYGRWGHPTLPLEQSDAASYSGEWKAASGETISIAPYSKRLTLSMSYTGEMLTMELFVEKKDHLFAAATTLDLVAERDGFGRVVRLRRTFGGAETVFERAK
jgi:predicted alpha/beta superfamily hydrolase